jgi:hypothetical protein
MLFLKELFGLLWGFFSSVMKGLGIIVLCIFLIFLPVVEIFFVIVHAIEEQTFLFIPEFHNWGNTTIFINKIYLTLIFTFWIGVSFTTLIYFASRLADFKQGKNLNEKEKLILEILGEKRLCLKIRHIIEESNGSLSNKFFLIHIHLACLTKFRFVETHDRDTGSFFYGLWKGRFRITQEGSIFLKYK